MDRKKYKKMLIALYGYLGIGIIDIVALLAFSYFFRGSLINSVPYAKAGLIAILTFGVIWTIFYFIFLASKIGKEFQKADAQYRREKKKLKEVKKK